MKKSEKAWTVAVIATVSVFVVGFLAIAVFSLFGNPLDRKNIRHIAEQYIADNYSEMNPTIVDIDYFDNYLGGPYQVEVYLVKSDRTFWLHYFSSGELDWDTYNYSIYEEKYGEPYYEKGIYAIRDIIGIPQNDKQKAVLAVINFDFEIQNGGLCQYLVNEDNENIVKITEYLRMIGAEEYAKLLEAFTAENDIELKALEIKSTDDYLEYEKSKPFDEFIRMYADIKNNSDCANDITAYVISYIQENIEDF